MKNAMKKISAMFLILALVFTLGGCMYANESFVINADGSGTCESLIEVEKAVYDAMLEQMAGIAGTENGFDVFEGETPDVVKKDGVEYYQMKESVSFSSLEELSDALAESYENVIISEAGIRMCMPSSMTAAEYEEAKEVYKELDVDIDTMLNMTVSFKMPEKISAVSKLGTISADGYTATFELGMKDMTETIEFMVSTAKETLAPTVSGIKNGSIYNKAVSFEVNDISGIKSAVYKKDSGKNNAFDFSKKVTKNGKYTVKATDYYGNTRTVKFTIKDTKKPTVTGVKNGKTYTSEKTIKFKDNCAVSKATLNGKKIKSGKTVSAKGSYKLVVTDVNGLKTTVSFKIK